MVELENLPRMHGDEPNGGMTHDPGIGSAPPRAGMNPHRSGPTGIDKNLPRIRGDEPRQEVCLVRNLLLPRIRGDAPRHTMLVRSFIQFAPYARGCPVKGTVISG